MNHADTSLIKGFGNWELYDADGSLVESSEFSNLVTQNGNKYYAERAAGISGAPDTVTGMKLGTGSTAVATTSAGSYIATYLTNSNQITDVGWPVAAAGSGTSRRITYQCTFPAGKATTASPITEAAIVNDALGAVTLAAPLATNTIARVVFATAIPSKSALQTLVIVWNHDVGS